MRELSPEEYRDVSFPVAGGFESGDWVLPPVTVIGPPAGGGGGGFTGPLLPIGPFIPPEEYDSGGWGGADSEPDITAEEGDSVLDLLQKIAEDETPSVEEINELLGAVSGEDLENLQAGAAGLEVWFASLAERAAAMGGTAATYAGDLARVAEQMGAVGDMVAAYQIVGTIADGNFTIAEQAQAFGVFAGAVASVVAGPGSPALSVAAGVVVGAVGQAAYEAIAPLVVSVAGEVSAMYNDFAPFVLNGLASTPDLPGGGPDIGSWFDPTDDWGDLHDDIWNEPF